MLAMTTLEWGLAASLLMSVAALLVALVSLGKTRKQAQDNQKLLERLTREVAASNNGTVGMGQRLMAMEKRLQTGLQKTEKIDLHQDEEFKSYTDAAQLFKMGFDAEEVARRCGLSRAEASLLEVMQKAGR